MLEASPVEQAAVQKARRALQEAEARYQTVRQWNKQFDHRVEPLGRNVEKLRHTLSHDLGVAVARLDEIMRTLSDYAELSPGGATPAQPAPSAEPKTAEPATGGAPA